jgi:hypothetical protein
MKRAVFGILAMCVGFAACGRDRTGVPGDDKAAEVRPVAVTETGCLTARGDQFVLTDLERGEGEATTDTFQLVGKDEELRPHVGKQVRVTGDADAPRVAVVQESTPPRQNASPQGTTGTADPKVSTQSETRVETRELKVSSVVPTGSSCAAETTGGASPTRPRQ